MLYILYILVYIVGIYRTHHMLSCCLQVTRQSTDRH